MAKGFNLVAEPRTDKGKGASRRLRRTGRVPAIIYGADLAPESVTVDHNSLIHDLEQEAFLSSVVTITIGGKEQSAIVKDVQPHPARRQILHLDLQRIVADEEIRMEVPIHFLNQDTAIGVKTQGGTVSHMMSEVEITCLPKDLPEYLSLDIAELELDQTLYLSDIKLPAGVTIPELEQGEEHNQGVVSIYVPKVVEDTDIDADAEELEAEADSDAVEDKDEKDEKGDKGDKGDKKDD